MIMMSVDPGGTTGIALFENDNLVDAITVPGSDHDKLANVFMHWIPNVLVIEDFIGNGPRSVEAISTLKLIGMFEGFSILKGTRFVVQQPQKRKPYLLRASTILTKRFESPVRIHAVDAIAHGLAYLKELDRVSF